MGILKENHMKIMASRHVFGAQHVKTRILFKLDEKKDGAFFLNSFESLTINDTEKIIKAFIKQF